MNDEELEHLAAVVRAAVAKGIDEIHVTVGGEVDGVQIGIDAIFEKLDEIRAKLDKFQTETNRRIAGLEKHFDPT